MADRIVVMNNGMIEQEGPPSEIYDNPASPFVANFIGTMNFLNARAVGHNQVMLGGIKMTVGEVAGLSSDGQITVCIRPEDVTTRGVDASTTNAIEATVAELEFRGSVNRATLDIKGDRAFQFHADFSANLMRDHAIAENKTVYVSFPPNRLHVFAGRFTEIETE